MHGGIVCPTVKENGKGIVSSFTVLSVPSYFLVTLSRIVFR